VVYLLERPAVREEMGRQGRARVEKELAWSYEAPKLLAAYNAIFADGK
jgi:glycosyltransferase involved in cell wall biosynthesis